MAKVLSGWTNVVGHWCFYYFCSYTVSTVIPLVGSHSTVLSSTDLSLSTTLPLVDLWVSTTLLLTDLPLSTVVIVISPRL